MSSKGTQINKNYKNKDNQNQTNIVPKSHSVVNKLIIRVGVRVEVADNSKRCYTITKVIIRGDSLLRSQEVDTLNFCER